MKITREQLKYILGDDWGIFKEKILTSCFCGSCKDEHVTRIVDWQARLDGFNDVILDGKCVRCGGRTCRVSEIGERAEYLGRIKEVKKGVK